MVYQFADKKENQVTNYKGKKFDKHNLNSLPLRILQSLEVAGIVEQVKTKPQKTKSNDTEKGKKRNSKN